MRALTNFWAHGSAAKEIEEIKVLVRAAKATGLRHVVWSTLEDTRELLPLEDERMPVLQDKSTVGAWSSAWRCQGMLIGPPRRCSGLHHGFGSARHRSGRRTTEF
ncbi:NmrA family NAD(P)-binding protein [Streptomyces sp. NPDC050619]|uniref:NmrA family NAD(P)-binding protein n=1 Tax=Streptomyces sp. NPDC050619 TaxID=3157214 RepID=UPI003412450E